jgi:Zn-dependent protease
MQLDPFSIFTIIALIFSIIVHEVAHGYAAFYLGDRTAKDAGRLTLNPLPHIDLFGSVIIPGILVLTNAGIMFGWAKPVPYNPYNLKNQRWGESIVSSAGVLVNLFLALVFALVARFTFEAMPDFAELAAAISLTNLFLGMFNLIPIPPLDGFGIVRGLIPPKYTLTIRAIEEKIQRNSIIFLVVFLFVFTQFLARPFSAFVVSIFMFLLGQ